MRYADEVSKHTNEINLKKALGTERAGAPGFRDRLVYFKTAWAEAQSYLGWLQSVIIFTALVPVAILTINGGLAWLGLGIKLPYELASFMTFIFIVGFAAFGFIAVRFLGTARRAHEIGERLNPANYLLWDQLEKTLEKLDAIEKRLDELNDILPK